MQQASLKYSRSQAALRTQRTFINNYFDKA